MSDELYERKIFSSANAALNRFKNLDKELSLENFEKYCNKMYNVYNYVTIFKSGAFRSTMEPRDSKTRNYYKQPPQRIEVKDVKYYAQKFMSEPWGVQKKFWEVYKCYKKSALQEPDMVSSKELYSVIKELKDEQKANKKTKEAS